MAATQKYKVGIEITDTPERVQQLGNLMQFAVTNVDNQDMMTLLTKVKSNPQIVKKALKFI
jgi:hypothetical protein